MTTPTTEQPYERTSGPIHGWFSLTYSNFLVLHRTVLQSMPVEWQDRMVELLEEMGAAYQHIEFPEFEVTTVQDRYVNELSVQERDRLGVTCEERLDEDAPEGTTKDSPDWWKWVMDVYHDRDGNELHGGDHIGVPVPDPIPHYRHAYLPPDEDAIARLRKSRTEAR